MDNYDDLGLIDMGYEDLLYLFYLFNYSSESNTNLPL